MQLDENYTLLKKLSCVDERDGGRMQVDKTGFLNMKVIFLEILVTITSILISCLISVYRDSIHYGLSIAWQKYALLEKNFIVWPTMHWQMTFF